MSAIGHETFIINFDVVSGQVIAPSCGLPAPRPTSWPTCSARFAERSGVREDLGKKSWLNQVEIWLSILVRKPLRRGSFTSVADLEAKVLAFIDYFNRTMA